MAIEGGHVRRNNGNLTHRRAFVIRAEEARQDPNIVRGTFTLNNPYATTLFNSGADYSFVSTTFIPVDGLMSRHKAAIVCHEKVVRILLPHDKILRVLGERPEEKDMDDLYITMKEYIQLMTDKGHRRDQEFNWEIATHGTVFRMHLYPFNYPTRSLTMEEILTKFIDEVKRVTTKGEKMTSEATPSKGDTDLMLPKSNFNDDEPWAIKCILKRSVGYNPKNWLEKLDDALWAFRTAYKIATRCIPFRLVYGKACHLPIEIEHMAYWALKQCNMDLTLGSKSRLMQLNELAKLRDGAYENIRIYKERTKKWHNSRLHGDKDFKEGSATL
nr:reverse transcriptase domain-containing protein [Tanacetum cinerariifolium]